MTASNPSRDGASESSSRLSRIINLRQFLSEAVFVGASDIQVRRCTDHADRCRPGDVFVPTHNANSDEADKAEEAIRRGAVAIVTERLLPVSVPQCLVEDTRVVYGQLCQALVGQPGQRMLTVGIVGSHGKTTTALFVATMLKKMAGAVAYYTSLGSSDSRECDRTATRPPGAAKLANWMHQADKARSPAVVIELSPGMLTSQVTAGIEFDLIIVTGMRSGQLRGSLSNERMSSLIQRLVGSLKSHGVVVVNADDAPAATFAESLEVPVAFYGLDAGQQIRGKRLGRFGGEQQVLAIAGNTMMPLTLKMPGDHVARAALAAIATSWIIDLPIPDSVAAIEALQSIPGRMQRISQAVDVPVTIDDGQAPDRVAVALHAIASHNMGPATVVMDLNQRLSALGRHRLGEVLEKAAKTVVLSGSDLSPETTQSIAMDVLSGCKRPGRVQVIPDREKAIQWAVANTHEGSLLLSGCGASSWVNRSGEQRTDEMVAKNAVLETNRKSATSKAKLSIFPPSSPTEFFAQ